MRLVQPKHFYKTLFFIYAPLIIIPHEFSHFVAFKHYNITPTQFSVGFGPTLYQKKVQGTNFKLSLLPFGGYVKVDDKDLTKLNWKQHIIVLLAGPTSSFLIFLPLLLFFKLKHNWSWNEINLWNTGFWERFTYLCFFFGIFNLLPIVYFDGGQIFITLWVTFIGPINNVGIYTFYVLSFLLFFKLFNLSNHPDLFPFLFKEKRS
ncbi:hypothetical protein D6777_03955 [Candidatus Woesearchaeota archaeon]|nr:MAG: hypothetical protein D6777_03955 [Candidatus Woesearchaeota archaeon]